MTLAMTNTPSGNLADLKAAYTADTISRFSRVRTQLGGTADAHIAYGQSYWRIRELCRDMDRNDIIISQMVDRAAENICGSGFMPIPDTGDAELDAEILREFHEWAQEPSRCDVGMMTDFNGLVHHAVRHMLADGDCLIVPSGEAMQFIEGDWLNSPSGDPTIIHGVEISDYGAPRAYWLQTPSAQDWARPGGVPISTQAERRAAFDAQKNRLVFHFFCPRRASQHRGMPALTPVVTLSGMFEDVHFAKIVQLQISACVGLFIKRMADVSLGPRQEQTGIDGATETLESLEPGLIIRGQIGEEISTINPNVTPQQWFEHIKLILRMIGANLGLPLSIAMMDTSDTTFHGYRGEINMAQVHFRKIQGDVVKGLLRPIYSHLVRTWAAQNGWNLGPKIRLTKHRWSLPGWRYVDPEKDAKADAFAMENLLVSPRDLHAERGSNWQDTVRETVDDRAFAISLAAKKAAEISKTMGIEVTWRDLLNLKTPGGVTIAKSESRSEVITESE